MTLLPVMDRELRLAARSPRTYLARFVAGAAALAVAIYLVWLAKELGGATGAGVFVLRFAGYAALAICLFAGVNRTADCLSSEKRQDTLGLLFLTHLKARDVVLGKLLAHSTSVLVMLLGIVPILALPILLGGVSAVELVRIPVALLNSLFFALCSGLPVSSLLRRQSATRTTVTAGMIILTLALPAVALDVVQRIWLRPTLSLLLLLPSPLYTLEMSFSSAVGLSNN
ncbi:MAG TPA: ABC transporter permease, partial [Verrucomicrobiae bacterium]|nr:ABC transporter permease [Verrucomicrobiae bacterium]